MCDEHGSRQVAPLLEPAKCPAYILAGGESSRFGSDKARVQIGAQSQILRLSDQLTAQGHSVHMVADRADRYRDLGITCLTDEPEHSGPMAGIAAALRHRHQSEAGWCLIVSCDQVVWRCDWYNALALHLQNQLAATFAFRRQDGETSPQPIPGLYHTDLLPTVLEQLSAGKYSVRELLALIDCESHLAASNPSTWSFNTAAELQAIIARLPAQKSDQRNARRKDEAK